MSYAVDYFIFYSSLDISSSDFGAAAFFKCGLLLTSALKKYASTVWKTHPISIPPKASAKRWLAAGISKNVSAKMYINENTTRNHPKRYLVNVDLASFF